MTRPDDVRIAVIVPCFGHPAFLGEAVQSALAQENAPEFHIVIVNDGCLLRETHLAGASLALGEARVSYLVQPNGGLSAARNRGIEHALAAFPALEAIFFLDADNRISPHTLASSYRLLAPERGIGWVYPGLDTFPTADHTHYGAPYSRLLHVAHENICDAGSLVARAIFERGARFDESLQHGLEDWDFWLQALDLGFQGVNNPESGFQYRRRAESMISETRRKYPILREKIREKHAKLYRFDWLMRAEHEEAPRYLALDPVTGSGRALSDPAVPSPRLSQAEIEDLFAAERMEPDTSGVPPLLLLLPGAVQESLLRAGLIWGLLHLISRIIDEAGAVLLTIQRGGTGFSFSSSKIAPETDAPVHALAMAHSDAVEGLNAPRLHLTVTVPSDVGIDPLPALDWRRGFSDLQRLRDGGSNASSLRWAWRAPALPSRRERVALVGRALGIDNPIGRIPAFGRKHVGVVVNAGAEDLSIHARAVLSTLVDDSVSLHLFVLGHPAVTKRLWEAAPFASMTFLSQEIDPARAPASIVGWFAGMDALLDMGAKGLVRCAGEFRRLGIRYAMMIEGDVGGEMVAVDAVHFEHAVHAFIFGQGEPARVFHALGVPLEKLIKSGTPNARARVWAALLPAD